MIDLLLEAARLKQVPRRGWLRCGISPAESVADHSWGVGWLVLLLLPPELNREKALTYATLHDLAEVRVGDITPHDGVSPEDKKARETFAMKALLETKAPHLLEAFHAYLSGGDPEAEFVRQLDRLEMAIQATLYAEDRGKDLHAFLLSARRDITHPSLLPLWQALAERHPALRNPRNDT